MVVQLHELKLMLVHEESPDSTIDTMLDNVQRGLARANLKG